MFISIYVIVLPCKCQSNVVSDHPVQETDIEKCVSNSMSTYLQHNLMILYFVDLEVWSKYQLVYINHACMLTFDNNKNQHLCS